MGWALRQVKLVDVLSEGLVDALVLGLGLGLGFGLVLALPIGWLYKRTAISTRLTLIWPSTRRQLLDFLRRARRGLGLGLALGLALGLVTVMGRNLVVGLLYWMDVRSLLVEVLISGTIFGLAMGLGLGLGFGLVLALGFGLLETRTVMITSRTPKEASSRSLIAALTWLVSGLIGGLVSGLVSALGVPLVEGLSEGLVLGLGLGLVLALRNGGWFVLLQKIAHRRLARAGNLPPRPYDFLEWGIEKQIFRRVGGGVRYRHNLIQQHLAKS